MKKVIESLRVIRIQGARADIDQSQCTKNHEK